MVIFGESGDGAYHARVDYVKRSVADATCMTELHTLSMKVIVSDTLVSCSSTLDNKLLKVLEPFAGAVCPQIMCSMHN